MAGLFIKELMIRGDLRRCLIICPGSLVEQWQDDRRVELGARAGCHFADGRLSDDGSMVVETTAFPVQTLVWTLVVTVPLVRPRAPDPFVGLALPPIEAGGWLNADQPILQEDLRGQVVLLGPPCLPGMPAVGSGERPDEGEEPPRVARSQVRCLTRRDQGPGGGEAGDVPLRRRRKCFQTWNERPARERE